MFTRLGCSGRPPHFVAEFYPYANLVQTIRLREETAYVRFSDLLRTAPGPVIEAAAAILLGKLYRKRVPRTYGEAYRRYSLAHGTRRRILRTRQQRAWRAVLKPGGQVYDLVPMFDRLNQEYFHDALPRPQLGWSARPWRTQLGCFDPALGQLVLSSRLDKENVPVHAVEYVLFHEMLHMKHPLRRASCGLEAHSAKFRAEERRYAKYEPARRCLRRLR
jgi:hypothetical protein